MELDEIKQRMLQKKLYFCNDPTLINEQVKRLDLVHEYNQLPPSHLSEKMDLLKKMFAEIGDDCYIETPFSPTGAESTYISVTECMPIST